MSCLGFVEGASANPASRSAPDVPPLPSPGLQMLFKIVPLNALQATTFTRYDGEVFDGSVSNGFNITDSFHAPRSDPSYSTTFNVNTHYGGGYGTGNTGGFGDFAGVDADGVNTFY